MGLERFFRAIFVRECSTASKRPITEYALSAEKGTPYNSIDASTIDQSVFSRQRESARNAKATMSSMVFPACLWVSFLRIASFTTNSKGFVWSAVRATKCTINFAKESIE